MADIKKFPTNWRTVTDEELRAEFGDISDSDLLDLLDVPPVTLQPFDAAKHVREYERKRRDLQARERRAGFAVVSATGDAAGPA